MDANSCLEACSMVRLFLSIDVIGSTAYKQRIQIQGEDGPFGRMSSASWATDFLNFFSSSEEMFKQKWLEIEESFGKSRVLKGSPELWKLNGDEAIFTVSVGTKDINAHIICMIAVAKAMAKELRDRFASSGIFDFKFCIWLAGFPINNHEMLLGGSTSNGFSSNQMDPQPYIYNLIEIARRRSEGQPIPAQSCDYLGPSMDVGFRLREHSSRRKMIVSADVADAFFYSMKQDRNSEIKKIKGVCSVELNAGDLKFMGFRELKGISFAKRYPVFFIDIETDERSQRIAAAEDEINNTIIDPNKIGRYLDLFMDGENPLAVRPYVAAENPEVPSFHGIARQKLISVLERYITVHEGGVEADGGGNKYSSSSVATRKDIEKTMKKNIGYFKGNA